MQIEIIRKSSALIAVAMLVILNGCATTRGLDAKDPWESWNRGAQSFNDVVDDYVMKPVAKGYDWIMPPIAHHAVSNFFSNIDDIDVFINDALQGKFAQSGMDTARLLINTTAGVAGFIDVGTLIDLPKHNEDFDQTLGIWGVYSGPYLVLPFFGPSSPRGVAGLLGDASMNPISYTGIYFSSSFTALAVSGGLGATKAINTRANNLGLEKVISEAAIDRYEFIKDAYIARRKFLINEGRVPEDDVLKFRDQNYDDLGPVNPY
ncbi:MAG: VacJ family lipoprotein [Methylomonas sp.]